MNLRIQLSRLSLLTRQRPNLCRKRSERLFRMANLAQKATSAATDGRPKVPALDEVARDIFYQPGRAGRSDDEMSQKSPGTAAPSSPDVILLFGWMDGKLPHLAKYVAGYNALFPDADVVLVRARSNAWIQSLKKQRDLVRPVRRLLERSLSDVDANGAEVVNGAGTGEKGGRRVLVHTFSNGGCLNLVRLAQVLQAGSKTDKDKKGSRFQADAFIFDSAPGKSTLFGIIEAFTVPIRNRLVKIFLSIMIGVFYVASVSFRTVIRLVGLRTLARRLDAIGTIRDQLNDVVPSRSSSSPPPLFPSKPRLYLYSKGDRLVQWQEVEEHARRASGVMKVRTERWESSEHVGHMRRDPERYWDAVKTFWADAVRKVD